MNKPQEPAAVEKKEEMISIWFWVAVVLLTYGLILVGYGIYYAIHPETVTATHELNPNLWWGAIMVVAGGFFFVAARKEKQGKAKT